ncbi:MAG: AI-2E family transporter [Solirubrobacterales bacterium]
MTTIQIESRTIIKVLLIALLAVAAAALAREVVSDVRDTLRWLVSAIFLSLALAPAVAIVERISLRGHHPPRWLAILSVFAATFVVLVFLVLEVIPPMIGEVEQVGSKGPVYVQDAEEWAENNEQFREINEKYHLTKTLSEQTSHLPGVLGGAAGELEDITLEILKNAISALTIVVISFFLLLEGPGMIDRFLTWLGGERERKGRRITEGIYAVVRGYVTVNLSLAIVAGLFTWGILEILGVDLAVPLAILMVFFDLIPLVGLTIGGIFIALVAALHDFPTALIVWLVAFLAYQQLQDRVVQPMLYGRAVQISPLVAILALLAGAQILGILGALLAIPVAASIGVVFSILRGESRGQAEADVGVGSAQPSPGSG